MSVLYLAMDKETPKTPPVEEEETPVEELSQSSMTFVPTLKRQNALGRDELLRLLRELEKSK